MNARDTPPPRHRELDAELAFHFAETIDALIASGLSAAEARAEAERRFGSPHRYRRDLARIDRTIHRRHTVQALLSFDFRDAVRSLRAAPLLTAVAILSLALGIGANTALFSIVNGLILRPLPVHEPSRLVLIDQEWTNPIWEQVRERQARAFDGALAWSNETFNLSRSGETDPVEGAYVSGDFFSMLGVGASRGRPLTREDDTRGGGPDGAVAVVSDGFWQRRFGRAADIVGRRLTVNQIEVTVVGVAPPGFFGPEIGRTADIYLPLAVEGLVNGPNSSLDRRSSWWLNMMARLKPGQTLDAAAAALNQWRPEIRMATLPANYGPEGLGTYLTSDFILVEASTGRSTLRQRFAAPLTIIMIVVAGVLLIACANIANLMLARATSRRQEMSLRLALGASRARLTRQLLAEGLLLAIAGSALGLLIAKWGGQLLISQLGSATNSVAIDLSLDWRVLGFTAAVALVTTVLFGLAPAAGLATVSPNEALKEQGRSVTGDRRIGLRNLLVVTQVALSLVLVIGAGLFVRTFHSLATTPLGFSPDRLLIVNVDAQRSSVGPTDRLALYQRAAEAAAAVPGIAKVSFSQLTPLSGQGWNSRVSLPADSPLPPRTRMTFLNAVTPGWIATYGMTLRAGRDLSVEDVKGSEIVTVVNETFAQRFLPAGAVGEHVELDGPGGKKDRFLVVGVVKDAIYRSARAGVVPTMFLAFAQHSSPRGFALTIAVAADRRTAVPGLKEVLGRVDPALTFSFLDYADQIRATTSQERLVAILSGFFGALALLLAALGLYGVTSYSVNRRQAEIAVRMALGADARRVLGLVLVRVGVLVLAGTVIGAGLSLWTAKFVGALLFRLEPRDPVTIGASIVVLASIGLLAGWLPARRATRVDPTAVLRQ